MKSKTKQRLIETEDKLVDWRFISILFILAFIPVVLGAKFLVFIDTTSYKQGFQDGQANVTQITCEGEYYAITTNWQYTDLITGNISYSKNYTKIGCVRK